MSANARAQRAPEQELRPLPLAPPSCLLLSLALFFLYRRIGRRARALVAPLDVSGLTQDLFLNFLRETVV